MNFHSDHFSSLKGNLLSKSNDWVRWCRSRFSPGKLIVGIGSARLYQLSDGRFRLVGGTDHDRQAVREWTSLFCHEAVWREDESDPLPSPDGGACRRRLVPRARRLRIRDRIDRCFKRSWIPVESAAR